MTVRQRSSNFVFLSGIAMVLFAGAVMLSGLAAAQSVRKDLFNHLTTGFPLTGAHEQAKCESCHVQGVFKGTPKDCLHCHGPSARISTVTMPQNHIPVTEGCTVCHTTTKFYGARYSHAGAVPGNCTQCHNGTTTATAKGARHIVTAASCDTCHRTTAWMPATFNHASVVPGSCAQCHNGTAARGKSPTHLLTSLSCDSCHATAAWSPGTRFNHIGVVPGTCGQCHNGTHARGQKPGHIPTQASCDSCHMPSGWVPARVDHSGVVSGTCAQCHDGKSATGKKLNHIPTASSCDTCHRTTAWKPTSFSHKGIAPGTCAQCHNGTTAAGKPRNHLVTASSCDSCHSTAGWLPAVFNHAGVTAGSCGTCHNGTTAAGRTASHIPVSGNACDACHSRTNYISFANTTMNHAAVPGVPCTTCHEAGKSFFGGAVVTRPTAQQNPAHPLTGECDSCHTTATFVLGGASKPANHIPTTQACSLCHTTPGNYSVAKMSHSGITRGCATCHGPGLSFANVSPRTQPPNHIPVPGVACESCHSLTNFSTFAGTRMNHAAVPAAACQTCHETGRSFFGVTMVTRPVRASHPASGDCGACHTTASFAGATVGKPANHIPTAQACTACHANPQDYKVYAMSHQGITSGCATCHGAGLSFATNFVPKTQPPAHIPVTGVACESCHSPTKFTSFSGTIMNHAGVGGIACQTCHEAGRTWFGVTTVTRPVRATHPASGDCGTCHTTTTFKVAAAKPANHIPTTQACTLCHSNPQDYKVFAMNHQGIASNCAQCHGPGLSFANVIPKAPPATHIPTNAAACESCHSPTKFTSFSGTAMNHGPVASITCATCHETGRSFFGVTIVTRPVRASHPPTGDCSACHTTATFVTASKPANHIPTTQACTLCHTTSDYSKAVMSHQGITSNCAQCHGPGLTFANVVPKAPPAKHIPYTGVACEACHSPTKFTNFANTRMNHTPVAAFKCMSCHELGMSWFGVEIKVRKDSKHFIGRDCNESGCHNTTTFSKRLLIPGASPDPRGANPLGRPQGRMPQGRMPQK
jgi:hypothetical protein